MKKYLTILAASIAAFAFTSCNKEEAPSNEINIAINVASPAGTATKAVKSSWENGDKIFIWLDDNRDADPQLTIVYDGSSWAVENSNIDSKDLKEQGILKYFYLSSKNIWSGDDIGTFTEWNFPQSDESTAVATPLVLYSHSDSSDAPEYTFVDNTLSLNLDHWKFGTNVQVTINDDGLYGKDGLGLQFAKEGYYSRTVRGIQIYDGFIRMSLHEDSTVCARALDIMNECTFFLCVDDSNWYNYAANITFTLHASDGKTFTYKVNNKTLPISNGDDANPFSAIKLAKGLDNSEGSEYGEWHEVE